MKIYVLRISTEEYEAEGEDRDEWFETLRDARHRRENLIAEAVGADCEGMHCDTDFEIECCTVAKLPRNELVLALLNRRGCFKGEPAVVVPAWTRTRREASDG